MDINLYKVKQMNLRGWRKRHWKI